MDVNGYGFLKCPICGYSEPKPDMGYVNNSPLCPVHNIALVPIDFNTKESIMKRDEFVSENYVNRAISHDYNPNNNFAGGLNGEKDNDIDQTPSNPSHDYDFNNNFAGDMKENTSPLGDDGRSHSHKYNPNDDDNVDFGAEEKNDSWDDELEGFDDLFGDESNQEYNPNSKEQRGGAGY